MWPPNNMFQAFGTIIAKNSFRHRTTFLIRKMQFVAKVFTAVFEFYT